MINEENRKVRLRAVANVRFIGEFRFINFF